MPNYENNNNNNNKLMKTKPICPYCDKTATLIRGYDLYPHKLNLKNNMYWMCYSCNAYVGCHKKTTIPLGNLANKELRKNKARAHEYCDELWKSKFITRTEMYTKLAEYLNIPVVECHFGLFDLDKCMKAVDWAIEIMPKELRLKVMFESLTKEEIRRNKNA